MILIQSQNSNDSTAETAGESVGEALAWIVNQTGDIGGFVGDFFHGIATGAGLENPTIWTWVGLGFGGLTLVSAISDLLKGDILTPVVKGAIGVAILGWVISG